jgi:hypothetical protein
MHHVPKTLLRPMRSEPGADPLGDALTSGGLRVLACISVSLTTLPFLLGDPIIKARCLFSTSTFEAFAISARSKGSRGMSWLVHTAEAALREDAAAAGGLSEWERLMLQSFLSFATCFQCVTLDECFMSFDAAYGAVTAAAARGLKPDEARAAGFSACMTILDMAAANLAVRHKSGRSDLLLQHGPLSSSVQFEQLYKSMLDPGKGGELYNILVSGCMRALSQGPVCNKGLC